MRKKTILFGFVSLVILLTISLPGTAQLKADFTSDVIEGCTPLIVNFSDLSTGNPTNYKWDLGDGIISKEKNPGNIYITPGIYSIKLVVTNENGKDSITKLSYINVYGLPDVSFSASNNTGCAPLNVQFKDNSSATSGTIANYIWDFGDGQVSKESSPKHEYIFSDTFNVTLSVISSHGCKKSATLNNLVKVPDAADAEFSYSYTNVCQVPAKVSITNTSNAKVPLTYAWLFGDGTTSTEKSPEHTYSTGGDFKIQLISRTPFGCVDTSARLLSIGSVKPSFYVADSVCTNQPVLFQNTSIPIPNFVQWNLGNGTTVNSVDTIYSYPKAGVYTVTMSADFGSCSGSVTKIVTVTDKPKAAFIATGNLSSCKLPSVIAFTNTSTGAASYKWIFGDGQTSSLPNPVHSFNSAAFYSVALVAFNTNGCNDTVLYKDFVKTGPPKIIGFNDLPIRGCAPKTINFKSVIESAVPVVSNLWDFGDGTTSALETPAHVYSTIGSYSVSLTIKTAEGCSVSYTTNNAVELGVTPKANFVAQPLAACAFLPVSFADKSSKDVNERTWFFGDGASSAEMNPSHLYMDTGYFDITLISKNMNCADTMVIKKYVKIAPPIAKFLSLPDCNKLYERTFTDKSVGALTWAWKFGDGVTSSEQSPSHIYAATGRYGVSLTVTNGACEYTKIDSINIVDEHPTFTYSPADQILCKKDVVLFLASGYRPALIANILWVFGDTSTRSMPSTTPGMQYSYGKAGTYNPMLITKDINGCYDTINKHLNVVVYGPTAAFSSAAAACVNTEVSFTDKSTTDGMHPIISYSWKFGDGNNSTVAGNVKNTYTTGGNINVQLTVTDSHGCVDSVNKGRAVFISKPIARFNVSDTLICSKNTITFTSLSTGLNLVNSWQFGDGTSVIGAKPRHTYDNAGIYSVNLTVTDKFGCRDSIYKPNNVTISNPLASFTIRDTIGQCPPLLVEPANASKNFQSLRWEFGDATNTSILNPQHYYGIPGVYNLRLIAKGYGNCYDTANQKILLKGPSGTLNYSTLTGCVPTSIAFSSTSKNVAEFVWDFNNGVLKHTADSTIKYSYTQYGSFLPKLVLVDAAGCKVSVENKNRIVISDLTAGIKIDKDKLNCDSALRQFNDDSKVYLDEIASYRWKFEDDGSVSSDANPTHAFYKPGTNNVSLVVTSKIGCVDSTTVPVDIIISKRPLFSVKVVDSVCESLPAKFFANNLGTDGTTISWQWSFGDGNQALIQNPVYTYKNGGNYNAGLIAVSSNGCTSSKNLPVSIFRNPAITAGIDTSVCYGASVVLKAEGTSSFSWKANAALSCLNCATPIAKPDNSGWFYTTGSSIQGCSAFDSVFVNVYKPFKVSSKSAGNLCLGQSLTLNATGSELYEWSPKEYLDNPYSAQPLFKPTVATNITYTVVGRDKRNCFSDTANVAMKVYPIPTISITDKSVTTNVGFSVQLKTASSADVTKWKWSPVTGIDLPYTASPFATPKINTTYSVVATNDGNCSARDEVSITVLCDGRNILVPNTFSPNNDGVNDRFFPRGKGLFNVKSFRVYNRWGQVVFEKMSLDANNAAEGWDGTFKGKEQALDVYVYMMEIVCDNGTINTINGNVTLLR